MHIIEKHRLRCIPSNHERMRRHMKRDIARNFIDRQIDRSKLD